MVFSSSSSDFFVMVSLSAETLRCWCAPCRPCISCEPEAGGADDSTDEGNGHMLASNLLYRLLQLVELVKAQGVQVDAALIRHDPTACEHAPGGVGMPAAVRAGHREAGPGRRGHARGRWRRENDFFKVFSVSVSVYCDAGSGRAKSLNSLNSRAALLHRNHTP